MYVALVALMQEGNCALAHYCEEDCLCPCDGGGWRGGGVSMLATLATTKLHYKPRVCSCDQTRDCNLSVHSLVSATDLQFCFICLMEWKPVYSKNG